MTFKSFTKFVENLHFSSFLEVTYSVVLYTTQCSQSLRSVLFKVPEFFFYKFLRNMTFCQANVTHRPSYIPTEGTVTCIQGVDACRGCYNAAIHVSAICFLLFPCEHMRYLTGFIIRQDGTSPIVIFFSAIMTQNCRWLNSHVFLVLRIIDQFSVLPCFNNQFSIPKFLF